MIARMFCLAGVGVMLTFAACASAEFSIDAGRCVPDNDDNPCTQDLCVDNQPTHPAVTTGTACSGGACDATGTCVSFSCTDGALNNDETGVDCGGRCAPSQLCGDGSACVVARDCTSGVCDGAVCQAPRCGDGVVRGAEGCDDGNARNGDGCDDGVGGSCRPTGCGNGVMTGNEACDDGNAVNGDNCDNNCTATACGNGIMTGTETCDDGNAVLGDGCDDGAAGNCTVSACGNGVRAGAEICDDGNAALGDGCDDGATGNCTVSRCGNGVRAGAETCDDGNATLGDGCDDGASGNCTVSSCGNGIIAGNETCDDGNTMANGNGCTATCLVDHLVINEVDYDQVGNDSAEFIEIFNGSGAAISLAGYKVVLVNGSSTPGAMYTTLDLSTAGTLASGGYLVIGSTTLLATINATIEIPMGAATNNIQNGNPDGIALIDDTNNVVIDALAYGGAMAANLSSFGIGPASGVSLVETTALVATDSNNNDGSLARRFNGRDVGNASVDWIFTATKTPGAGNP
jgi:cysteine-rich repeat protein